MVSLRRLMFETMGFTDAKALDAADAACLAYFARAVRLDEYRGWVAVTPGQQVVASGGLVLDRHPPGPHNLAGRSAYIMNMITDPAYRRQGLAQRIFAEIMAWVREQGIAVASLHATDPGRPLYEKFGFRPSNEMTTGLCCAQN
jgi:GNAT superfamily N-acetyltransferase